MGGFRVSPDLGFFMTYPEKLRDPRWQKKRLEILQRDGWKCVICHAADKELQVHHAVYRRLDPWAYPDYCYQSLCRDCHQTRGELTDKAVDAFRLAMKDIPTERLAQAAQRMMGHAMQTMEAG